jgi:hypothetical protein
MFKVYRSAIHPGHWVAYGSRTGWVIFPARDRGWDDRKQARGLDPAHLREVSAELALQAGVPESELRPGYFEAA